MQLTLEQTATRLGKSKRQVLYMIQKGRLQLSPKRWDVIPNTHPSIFLGYRISRAGITSGRKLRRSMSRRLRGAARKGHVSLVRSLESYRGLLLF